MMLAGRVGENIPGKGIIRPEKQSDCLGNWESCHCTVIGVRRFVRDEARRAH